MSLDLDHVAVDLEAFLGEAAAGLALHDEGLAAQAHARLSAAEAAYAGDLLEEDLYEDWAVAAREQARDMYVRVARRLAGDAHAAGDHDGAVRFLLRVLERDAYDEEAHLALVSALVDAGRHGEARRAFRVYRGRMDEVGVEPASFPASDACLRPFEPAIGQRSRAMETFLVRVWVPSEPHESRVRRDAARARQHVRSGVATAFTESEQLCAWLGAMAAEQRGVGKRAHAAEGSDSRGG